MRHSGVLQRLEDFARELHLTRSEQERQKFLFVWAAAQNAKQEKLKIRPVQTMITTCSGLLRNGPGLGLSRISQQLLFMLLAFFHDISYHKCNRTWSTMLLSFLMR